MPHVPVMVAEVMQYLNPRPGAHFVDCTLGEGGHTGRILELSAPDGRVLAFDLDREAIRSTCAKLAVCGDRLIAVHSNYSNLKIVLEREKFGPVSGVLLDLGFSAAHIEERGRGFTFMKDEPLDMRYSGGETSIGGHQELTAAEIVNSWPKDEIAKVIADYGEERMAQQIASAIVTARRKARILTTMPLVDVIRGAVGGDKYEQGRINPATRTFQALRIAVNDEFGSIEKVLPQALEALETGGVLVTIAFHSLEDRICKQYLQDQEKAGTMEILTDKPMVATEKEVNENPRSRSAKLRAARKI